MDCFTISRKGENCVDSMRFLCSVLTEITQLTAEVDGLPWKPSPPQPETNNQAPPRPTSSQSLRKTRNATKITSPLARQGSSSGAPPFPSDNTQPSNEQFFANLGTVSFCCFSIFGLDLFHLYFRPMPPGRIICDLQKEVDMLVLDPHPLLIPVHITHLSAFHQLMPLAFRIFNKILLRPSIKDGAFSPLWRPRQRKLSKRMSSNPEWKRL